MHRFPSRTTCTLPLGALGCMGKVTLAFPVSQWLALIVDYACIICTAHARLEVKWSEKDLFLAWRERHPADSQCGQDHPSLVLPVLQMVKVFHLATTGIPTWTKNHEHLTCSYSSGHTITKLRGDKHVYWRRPKCPVLRDGLLKGLVGS